MSAFIEITEQNYQETVKKYPRLILKFTAVWCGPCKMLDPMLHSIAQEIENEKFAVGSVNVDSYPDIALQFDVMNVPTMVFLKDGDIFDMEVTVPKKSALENKINSFLE